MIPANHSAAPPVGSTDTGQEAKYYGGHDLYSDDGGETWRLGFVDATYTGVNNANESSAAELPDGRLYFSSRDQLGTSTGNRLDTYSSDGVSPSTGPTRCSTPWTTCRWSRAASSNSPVRALRCCSRRLPCPPCGRAWRFGGAWIFSGSFVKAVTLSGEWAGYSDLVRVGSDTVGVLYETGATSAYDTITFRRLPTAPLSVP